MGFHEAPTSVLFHTPPATPPKYHVIGSPATPLTATTRPPRKGPICRHFMPPSNAGWMSETAALHSKGIIRSNARIATDDSNRCLMIFVLPYGSRGGVSYRKGQLRPHVRYAVRWC